MPLFEFWDYVEGDDDVADNVIKALFREWPKGVGVNFDTAFRYHAVTPYPEWVRPPVGRLGRGLLEFRERFLGSNYRVFASVPENGVVYLLGGMGKNENEAAKDRAQETARDRMSLIEDGRARVKRRV